MSDILGPANAAFATTNRPTDTRVYGALDSWFADCSSPTAGDGTDVDAAWLNGLTANLRAVVRNSGNTAAGPPVTPPDNSDNMVLNGILDLVQRGLYGRGVDTGAVNALAVTLPHTPAELVDGMIVSVKAKITNTGPTTLTVGPFQLPVKNRAIAQLSGGEIIGGAWQDYRVDLTNECFQIATSSAISTSRLWHTGTPMGGTSTALTTTLTDPVTSSTPAPIYMLVNMGSLTMGPAATLNFGAGPMPVVINSAAQSAPVGYEAPAGYDALLSWDGGENVVLLNPQSSLGALYAEQENASAFTPNVVLSDMPNYGQNYVVQTLTITGASYIDATGQVGLENTNSQLTGMTAFLSLGGVGAGPYLGSFGANSFQLPTTVHGRWTGLNPAQTYTLTLQTNKSEPIGPVIVRDAQISAYYGR